MCFLSYPFDVTMYLYIMSLWYCSHNFCILVFHFCSFDLSICLFFVFVFSLIHMTWLCTYTFRHCAIVKISFLFCLFVNVLCLYAFLCFFVTYFIFVCFQCDLDVIMILTQCWLLYPYFWQFFSLTVCLFCSQIVVNIMEIDVTVIHLRG